MTALVSLARPPRPDELGRAAHHGARALAVDLYGGRAAVHDWHAQAPGSFEQTLEALTFARTLGLTTVARTPITRSNAAVLGEIPELLKAHGVARWILAALRGDGGPTAIAPRFGLGVPPALAALARARALRIDARIGGAPLCALGPLARWSLPTPPRSYGRVCGGCGARAACAGVDPDYAARFGEGELRPCEAPRPTADADALTRAAWREFPPP